MNSKKVKIFGITLIMLLLIGISNYSFGFDVFKEDIPTYVQTAPKGGKHFHPTGFGSNVLFCIQWGGSFRASLTKKTYDYYTADSTRWYKDWTCEQTFKDLEPPWEGKLNYLRYEEAGNIDYYSHQDEAYTLATAKERENLEAWDTAYATWASSVSNPRQAFDESAEGDAYELFYKEIHSGRTDIFETKLKDSTDKKKVKVGVNQVEGSYTVGPFKVSYPNGQYGGKNLFDWIREINLVTTEEEGGEKELKVTLPYSNYYTGEKVDYKNDNNVKLYDKAGKEIDLTKLAKEDSERLSEFYIKFKSTTATRVKVKITFGYLEHCKAIMTKYTGKFMYWKWDVETSSTKNCPHACTHVQSYKKTCSNSPQCSDLSTCTHLTNSSEVESYQHSNDDDYKKRYILVEEEGGASQTLMAVGETWKHDETAELELAGPEGIDLTIELGGRVWLDKDNGKINTGDQKYGSGEALPGVEVALYRLDDAGKRTNTSPLTVSESIAHTHTGSPTTGGGCYRRSCIPCT